MAKIPYSDMLLILDYLHTKEPEAGADKGQAGTMSAAACKDAEAKIAMSASPAYKAVVDGIFNGGCECPMCKARRAGELQDKVKRLEEKLAFAEDSIRRLQTSLADEIATVYALSADLDAMSPAFFECAELRKTRGAEYNGGSVKREDHFPLGDDSYFQMVWIKALRLRSEIESDKACDKGKLKEHLRDLINYASYWWERLDGSKPACEAKED